jgi:arylsulfatase A-like enzyme
MPSILDHLGLADKQAAKPPSPGRSFAPALRGDSVSGWPDAVFFEFENVRAVRTAEWKYIERIHEEPNELYHLTNDPGERLNLYGREGHEAITAELRKRLRAFFARYADPKWDLWKGGRSKSGLINAKLFGLTIQE